jgi:DNA modification methylase
VDHYYADDSVTIYHGDCREVLPTLPLDDVSLCLTDPPYGIDLQTDYSRLSGSTRTYKKVAGDDEPFDPTPLLRFPRVVLWGANHYADSLPIGGWLVWDKRAGKQKPNMFADAELAWCNFRTPVRVFSHLWGVNRASEQGNHLHPTQKPVALMRWILEAWTEPNDLVLDPYMGSGPVAEACRNTGRRYIGIELEESYCAAAVRRLAQEVLAV